MSNLLRIDRALKQPIYLISADYEDNDNWKFKVQGYSGNHYNISINPYEYNCTCPDYIQRGQICKHIYFIIGRVAQDQNCLLRLTKDKNPFDIKSDLTDALKIRLSGRLNNDNNDVVDICNNIEEYGDCCICFEEITSNTNNFQCSLCKNYIHISCINRWIKNNNNCPLCRNNINHNIKDNNKDDNQRDDLTYFTNFIMNLK